MELTYIFAWPPMRPGFILSPSKGFIHGWVRCLPPDSWNQGIQ